MALAPAAIPISKPPRARTTISPPNGTSRRQRDLRHAVQARYRRPGGAADPAHHHPQHRADTDDFVVTQPVNASDGKLDGFELGFQFFPSNLPAFLDGLGLWAAIPRSIPRRTFRRPTRRATSSARRPPSSSRFPTPRTTSRSPTKPRLGMRLSYVWREKFLNNNEARLFANPIGIWRRPEAASTSSSTGRHRQLLGVVRRREPHRRNAAVLLPLRRCGRRPLDELRQRR